MADPPDGHAGHRDPPDQDGDRQLGVLRGLPRRRAGPGANRVGAENDGWRVTNVTLKYERGTAFVSELVDSLRLCEDAAEYVATRRPARARPVCRGVRRAVGPDQAQHLSGLARRDRAGRAGDQARVHRSAPAFRRALPPRARPGCAARRRQRARRGTAPHARARRSPRAHRRSNATSSANGCSACPREPSDRWTSSSTTTRSRCATASRRCSRACAHRARPRRFRSCTLRRSVRRRACSPSRRRILVVRLRGGVRTARPRLRARTTRRVTARGRRSNCRCARRRLGGVCRRARRRHPARSRDVRTHALNAEPSPWPLDPCTPIARVDTPPDRDHRPRSIGTEWHLAGAVCTAAFQLGLADWLTQTSVAYAKERVQFDRPIGGFQAIKHICADMLVRTEVGARRRLRRRARTSTPPPIFPVSIARSRGAKGLAGEAAIANGKAATQVHGGMGFTWEVDVHLYLKRAWVLDTHFGSSRHCTATRSRPRRRCA